ncbi:MAG TPA: putative sulfate exporter family transporter [Verrucomicrobiae bacterium]|nr:putative sulfate exporter family transporter [Verrucomicrobiae bacterium]
MTNTGSPGPARPIKILALIGIAICLVLWASPPAALAAGILFALLIGHPLAQWNHKITKWLLQICVILLGFGMNLQVVLRLGLNGSLFAATTICATLVLGFWLGRKLKLDGKTSALISAGTAICGGSAIAAVSSVIGATESEIAVSIGSIFLLNAVALYVFPAIGHLLHLSQGQFGLWAGVAIHDISSVVGAGLSYGTVALNTATAVKLSRTLWIVPLTLGLAFACGKNMAAPLAMTPQCGIPARNKTKISVPWFIGLFLLASLTRSCFPVVANCSPEISAFARRGMILVLFLIGTSLSLRAVKAVGWRTATVGLLLWIFISSSSLIAIKFLKLSS